MDFISFVASLTGKIITVDSRLRELNEKIKGFPEFVQDIHKKAIAVGNVSSRRPTVSIMLT
jgi:hypothetical protein